MSPSSRPSSASPLALRLLQVGEQLLGLYDHFRHATDVEMRRARVVNGLRTGPLHVPGGGVYGLNC
ncbi:hypothetical protein GGP72_000342 [Salinibacter ruber]|uniref:Uncharacterized protein n=1 Tax=Salinibacter ruber TaxID=146919 RepID=A0A9X2Q496_9BACT|nr:hypothetical protein [Salinibacter ruber]MCS3676446.1 hypothetical protein [Salinibacter ruber]MCS3679733.1 hypothetical protein [Salinibacter ruber]